MHSTWNGSATRHLLHNRTKRKKPKAAKARLYLQQIEDAEGVSVWDDEHISEGERAKYPRDHDHWQGDSNGDDTAPTNI